MWVVVVLFHGKVFRQNPVFKTREQFSKEKLDLIPFLHRPGSVPKCLVSSAQRGRRGKLNINKFDFLDPPASLAEPFVADSWI